MTAMPPTLPALPRHLAVIMDGNGRWAQQRLRPRIIGHRAGARAVNVCIDFCLERGIRALTLFAFSSENWGRPQEEVGALMKLFMGALDREVEELHRRGVRVRFIGERARFSAGIRERIEGAEVPVPFRGVAIAMVTAGLMALAFMGFAGLDKYQ